MVDRIRRVMRVTTEDGEWEAFYIGNSLVCQGHSLDYDVVLTALQGIGPFEYISHVDEYDDEGNRLLMSYGQFPDRIVLESDDA